MTRIAFCDKHVGQPYVGRCFDCDAAETEARASESRFVIEGTMPAPSSSSPLVIIVQTADEAAEALADVFRRAEHPIDARRAIDDLLETRSRADAGDIVQGAIHRYTDWLLNDAPLDVVTNRAKNMLAIAGAYRLIRNGLPLGERRSAAAETGDPNV